MEGSTKGKAGPLFVREYIFVDRRERVVERWELFAGREDRRFVPADRGHSVNAEDGTGDRRQSFGGEKDYLDKNGRVQRGSERGDGDGKMGVSG